MRCGCGGDEDITCSVCASVVVAVSGRLGPAGDRRTRTPHTKLEVDRSGDKGHTDTDPSGVQLTRIR